MEYSKITVGFVVQDYSDEGICTNQEFIAGEEVEYENKFGEPVNVNTEAEVYQPFDMVQPVQLLQEPLSDDQLRGSMDVDANNVDIDVTIAVPLSEVINFDFENLMAYFENNILKNAVLSDIIYEMVGCDPLCDMLYFHVEAIADLP